LGFEGEDGTPQKKEVDGKKTCSSSIGGLLGYPPGTNISHLAKRKSS